MKLIPKQYEQEEVGFTSKVTMEKHGRKSVFIGAHFPIAQKVFTILKREYSILGIQGKDTYDDIPVVDLNNTDQLIGFLLYNAVDTVVISSEILADKGISNPIELLSVLVDFAKKNQIKMIFIAIDHLFETVQTNSGLAIEIQGTDYSDLLLQAEQLFEIDCNLIVKCSALYGFNELDSEPTFIEILQSYQNRENPVTLNNEIFIEPVLSDEFAVFVSSNFNQLGILQFQISGSPVTYYEFAVLVSSVFELKYVPLIPSVAHSDLNKTKDLRYLEQGLSSLKRQRNCSFNVVYRFNSIDLVNEVNIASVRVSMGRSLAGSIPESVLSEIDYIVPVPKTGKYYAMGFAEASGIPFMEALIKDSTRVRSFHLQNADVRKNLIWDKIKPLKNLLEGKTVALVDEAIFTGTTLKVVCEMVRSCGVKAIHLCIPTPECRYHCNHFVQPKRKMLLEYLREDMLCFYFGVESVHFQKSTNFHSALSFMNSPCTECFLGKNDPQ